MTLTRDDLQQRLDRVREAREGRLREHRRLKAAVEENAAYINALNGREAELLDLLATMPVGEEVARG